MPTSIESAPRRRRPWRLALRLALALLAALLLPELLLRLVLFHDVPGCAGPAARLRHAERFFYPFEQEYWTTALLFADPARLEPVPGFDPLLGWRGRRVAPETFAHPAEEALAGRRPLLLYGDSFAQCKTPRADCFEGLLQRSELGATHGLLNYGIGGYGLDQIYLLLRASLPRFAGREPLVVVGVMLDDDLDRAVLEFRGWPKPRFWLAGGRLLEPAPVAGSAEEYAARHPPEPRSWLWRMLVRRGTLPARFQPDRGPHDAEVRALSRALFGALKAELDASGAPWFVLLFQGDSVFRGEGAQWQEAFTLDLLHELGIPFVHAGIDLRRHREESGEPPGAYFDATGHYTALGNEVAFQALLRGLRGERD